jgi:predicted transcriptional regulator of viral defense system
MKYIAFRENLKAFPVFSTREIEKLFPGFDSRRLVEWQEKGYIRKLRNRYYHFSDQPVDELFLFFAANTIYRPSYVSLESALSRYGFIPEGVFQITSCTTLKTNAFNTTAGHFSYRRIRPSLYFGYQLEQWNGHRIAMACPEKALIDYLYLHHEVTLVDDLAALRFNVSEIKLGISVEKLNLYEKHINSPALTNRLRTLKTFLDAAA